MSEAVTLAIFGILSLMITVVLVGLFKIISNQDASQKSLIKSLDENTKSNKAIAEATTKSAKEAEQRNGHLGEQNIKLAKLVNKQNIDVSQIMTATKKTAEILSKSALIAAEDRETLLGVNTQVIKEQIVDHQTVTKSEEA